MGNRKRNILFLIFGVIILGAVSVFAGGYLSNTNQIIGNYSVNNTGAYYSDSKAFVRTADVIVCKGSNQIIGYKNGHKGILNEP